MIAVCPTLEGGGNNTGGTRPPGDSLVVANSLNGNSGRQQIEQTYVPVASTGETAHCLNAGAMGRIDYETETLVSHAPQAYRIHGENSIAMRGSGVANVADPVDTARCLDTSGGYAANQGGNVVLSAIAFKPSHFTRGKDGAPSDVAPPLSADADKGDQDTLVFDTTQITSRSNYSNPKIGDPCHPLAAEAHPPAIAFSCKDHGADAGEISPTLRAMEFDGSHANGGGQVAIAFEPRFVRNGRGAPDDISSPLKAQSGRTGKGDGATCLAAFGVRRLTPTECERLQGYPDHFTAVRKAADGPRYKALGNSMAVPCVRWIMQRIERANGHA